MNFKKFLVIFSMVGGFGLAPISDVFCPPKGQPGQENKCRFCRFDHPSENHRCGICSAIGEHSRYQCPSKCGCAQSNSNPHHTDLCPLKAQAQPAGSGGGGGGAPSALQASQTKCGVCNAAGHTREQCTVLKFYESASFPAPPALPAAPATPVWAPAVPLTRAPVGSPEVSQPPILPVSVESQTIFADEQLKCFQERYAAQIELQCAMITEVEAWQRERARIAAEQAAAIEAQRLAVEALRQQQDKDIRTLIYALNKRIEESKPFPVMISLHLDEFVNQALHVFLPANLSLADCCYVAKIDYFDDGIDADPRVFVSCVNGNCTKHESKESSALWAHEFAEDLTGAYKVGFEMIVGTIEKALKDSGIKAHRRQAQAQIEAEKQAARRAEAEAQQRQIEEARTRQAELARQLTEEVERKAEQRQREEQAWKLAAEAGGRAFKALIEDLAFNLKAMEIVCTKCAEGKLDVFVHSKEGCNYKIISLGCNRRPVSCTSYLIKLTTESADSLKLKECNEQVVKEKLKSIEPVWLKEERARLEKKEETDRKQRRFFEEQRVNREREDEKRYKEQGAINHNVARNRGLGDGDDYRGPYIDADPYDDAQGCV